ncbi:aspartate aminotransferase family protein [Sinorhizobium sp. 8-89]|uniref:aspartate aminotransferase family protein n=1 Tax=Sinorhizobium sp. 7-81 TaxID=3049087 RepID=UPI0024C2679F|nr:aspartate aminotransferase family protein [Sinorhizobium sp. 7-81]MDK1389789.1 aspartate aminotransferase family protein [Sinorhizobium sp. 7-81]
MSSVFHRQIHGHPETAEYGDGVFVITKQGKRYLDASSGGVAVSCLGHNNAEVIDAIERQLRKLPFFHGFVFTTEALEELAEELVSNAPSELTKAFFVSSGSEAVETAVLLARQAAVERGDTKRKRIIARRNSYHGATINGFAVGHNVVRRSPFLDMAVEMSHIAPCYEYRHRLPGESLKEYSLRAANELETQILALGADEVLAFVAETVGGSASGAVPPVPGYFKRVREICDKYGVTLILDEVLCGLGRTGTLHAFSEEGIVPDLVALAKGLGAGYQPIGAVLVSSRIHEAIGAGSGMFRGGGTYTGHASACAAALTVQRIVRRDRLVEKVAVQGQRLQELLKARFGNNPFVGDVRGRGFLQCIELVADQPTKAPFEKTQAISSRIRDEAMNLGLICFPGAGTVDGLVGDHIVLAPPFITTPDQIEEMVDKLGKAVDSALAHTCSM